MDTFKLLPLFLWKFCCVYRTPESSLPDASPCLVIAPREFQLDEEESVWITVPQSSHRNMPVELLFDDGVRHFGRIERTLLSSGEYIGPVYYIPPPRRYYVHKHLFVCLLAGLLR